MCDVLRFFAPWVRALGPDQDSGDRVAPGQGSCIRTLPSLLKSDWKEVGVVEPIYVDGWEFDSGRYSRGSFIVERVGNGLRATMKQGADYVQIGTTRIEVPGDTTRFLGKVIEFQKLKERVYA